MTLFILKVSLIQKMQPLINGFYPELLTTAFPMTLHFALGPFPGVSKISISQALASHLHLGTSLCYSLDTPERKEFGQFSEVNALGTSKR